MTQEQFPIRFSREPNYSRTDFVLSGCNALAADWVDRWPDWPGHIKGVVISGAASSGKSHLGAIWQQASGARLLTRIDELTLTEIETNPHLLLDHPKPNEDWPQSIFFHLLNRLANANGSVLILSRIPATAQDWALADLQSRLGGMVVAQITTPDDEALISVMHKVADDIGLALTPEASRYIASRIERSFDVACKVIEKIDKLALSRKKTASLLLVRQVLDDIEPRLL